jgi:SEC-C motif-containing protein
MPMKREVTVADHDPCPCGSQLIFVDCCAPYLRREALPAYAEQLMRSRYSAFVLHDAAYLRDTWHTDYRPRRVSFRPGQRWLGLSIRNVDAGGPEDSSGSVEFVARFKFLGRGHRLHEVSRFEQVDGRWMYCDGEIRD